MNRNIQNRPGLSKSKLMAFRQCPKRLWLQTYKPDLAAPDSSDVKRRYEEGKKVGEIAQSLYGPGHLIEPPGGLSAALQETERLMDLADGKSLFEATFDHDGLLIRADALIPCDAGYRLIEVKSSTQVKPTHIEDLAVQVRTLHALDVPIRSYAVAHIDTEFTYRGDGDYRGLFKEIDLQAEVPPLESLVDHWVSDARLTLKGPEPTVDPGPQCSDPYPCPFSVHCAGPQPDYPVSILPRIRSDKVEELKVLGILDVRDIPPERLSNPTHVRVWRSTIADAAEVHADLPQLLRSIAYPRFYLDFETIQFAVPVWADTKPYQQLPFQWSCHVEHRLGVVEHHEFLADGTSAPMRNFADSLLSVLGDRGPVVVYSGFEKRILSELAIRFPDLRQALEVTISRLLDLLPIFRDHYYHPSMKGSWSIKKVLPTVAPELNYEQLEGVRDGGGAQDAFLELRSLPKASERAAQIREQLLRYCERDTEAMLVMMDRVCRTL